MLKATSVAGIHEISFQEVITERRGRVAERFRVVFGRSRKSVVILRLISLGETRES